MTTIKSLLLSCALLGALFTAPARGYDARPAPDAPSAAAPEAATGYTEKAGWRARKFMVSAANPLAVDAGYRMLKRGGAAIDAAIAAQMVLCLVEPQSSG